jgi:hypothetical protein
LHEREYHHNPFFLLWWLDVCVQVYQASTIISYRAHPCLHVHWGEQRWGVQVYQESTIRKRRMHAKFFDLYRETLRACTFARKRIVFEPKPLVLQSHPLHPLHSTQTIKHTLHIDHFTRKRTGTRNTHTRNGNAFSNPF